MKEGITRRKCLCGTDPDDGILDCSLCYGHGEIYHNVEIQGDTILFDFRGHLYTSHGLTDDHAIGDWGLGYDAQWVVGKSLPR